MSLDNFLDDVTAMGVLAAAGRELGVLSTGVALGILLVRQPAKQACPGQILAPDCLQLAEFTASALHVSLLAGALLLLASAVASTRLD